MDVGQRRGFKYSTARADGEPTDPDATANVDQSANTRERLSTSEAQLRA